MLFSAFSPSCNGFLLSKCTFPQLIFGIYYDRDVVKMKLTFLSCPLESVWVFVRASFACSLRFPRCICRVLDSSTRSWTGSSPRGPRRRNRRLPLHPLILKEVTHQIQIWCNSLQAIADYGLCCVKNIFWRNKDHLKLGNESLSYIEILQIARFQFSLERRLSPLRLRWWS